MTTSLTAARIRRRVGAPDLLWLAWRQHRWTIVSGVVLVAGLCGYMLSNEAGIVPVTYQSCGPNCFYSSGGFFPRTLVADLQLWLARSGKTVPRKIVINYRTEPGSPEYIAVLSDWKFPKHIPDAHFRRHLPIHAQCIEFLKVKEVQP